ncbi:hypothetical protein NPIL_610421 [Nephila pilipes]|uniref:Uncharacterized protein n=1 Tax=Nephila pilipes TaxID=299642 RepID=A0A8X6MTD3_NEPPI|nr:hypothetical protein NPIL_610421 [Nephila pilipes]
MKSAKKLMKEALNTFFKKTIDLTLFETTHSYICLAKSAFFMNYLIFLRRQIIAKPIVLGTRTSARDFSALNGSYRKSCNKTIPARIRFTVLHPSDLPHHQDGHPHPPRA